MTAAQAFGIANPFALLGWIVLVAAILLGRPFRRDSVAGLLWPLALSVGYVNRALDRIRLGRQRRGLTRLVLIPVLPLTFMFGPAGLLLFCVLRSIIPAGKAS